MVICSLYIFVKQENSEKTSHAKKIQREKKRQAKILKMFLQLVKTKNPMRDIYLHSVTTTIR